MAHAQQLDLKRRARAPKARDVAASGVGDAGSKQLEEMAKKLGNGEVKDLVSGAAHKRDQLLAFVSGRLDAIQKAQAAEAQYIALAQKDRREIGNRKRGFTLPDLTRWRPAAMAYKKAVEALGRGQIDQAARAIQKAVEVEKRAFEKMPDHAAKTDAVEAPKSAPAMADNVGDGEAAPPVAVTAQLRQISAITRLSDASGKLPVWGVRPKGFWWDTEVEEAGAGEDEDEEKKKKKRRKKPDAES